MDEKTRRLGAVLVEKGVITAPQLDEVLRIQEGSGRRLGEVLVERGLLDEEALRWALAEQLDLPLVHPDPAALAPEALALVAPDVCRRYAVVPLHLAAEAPGAEAVLTVAAADPSLRPVLEDLQARTGKVVRFVPAPRGEIEAVLSALYGPAAAEDVGVRVTDLAGPALAEILEDATGARLLGHLLDAAVARGQEVLHFRARDAEARVDDGRGRVVFSGGETWHTILLDRLRQLAGLPASQGRPGGRILQRGRFAFSDAAGLEQVLFRVSILRGVEGEEAQVKRMRREGVPRHLTDLGFTAHQCLEVRRALGRPGLVWVTAPGDGGMGSTLFGLLREIPGAGRTFTLEEEVFYRSPDLLQLETLDLGSEERSEVLRELKYLDFPRVLVDRASPAQLGDLLALAVRKRWILAGGHEATLEETLTSLAVRSVDVPLYGLSLVVHQRLVPLLCPTCRAQSALGTAERQALLKLLPGQGTVYQEGSGCDACGGRGTRGARAFFEVLPVDAAVREDLYGAARGECRIPNLAARVRPRIAPQVSEAVARGEVSLSEIWDFV
ncbi:MAG: hypothetical protein HZB55_05410 [Deltaproteobacteria bacterium]|nr:hypothetical protein [Deltaproteobacteria bacterium]